MGVRCRAVLRMRGEFKSAAVGAGGAGMAEEKIAR